MSKPVNHPPAPDLSAPGAQDRSPRTDTRGLQSHGLQSHGIQSIEVGLSLLQPLIDAGGPLALKTLSERAGLPPAKAHRYLVSLQRMGLVTQQASGGRYGLGPLAVELGLAALGLLDRDALGRQAIADLLADVQQTTCLVTWTNGGPTVAAVEAAPGALFIGIRVGTRLSPVRSASGLVFLAHLPDAQTRSFVNEAMAEAAMDEPLLRQRIEETRREGFGRVRDSVMAGMSGIAAPVFDHSGAIAFTLTILGPSGTIDTDRRGALVGRLIAAAHALSERLGAGRHTSAPA
jgi:DNA-binding IclR family transcriptional regulator